MEMEISRIKEIKKQKQWREQKKIITSHTIVFSDFVLPSLFTPLYWV